MNHGVGLRVTPTGNMKKVTNLNKRISQREINKLYADWATPDKVKAHCKAVSDVGVKLGEELNKHGYSLDLSLIKGAGLAHDVARTKERHDLIGWDILEKMGYKDEADIVKVHMRYPKFNDVDNLNECDIVCLADRLVKENKYVGLDERIDYILDKAKDSPEAIEHILKNKKEIGALIDDIEKVIGVTLDRLFEGG